MKQPESTPNPKWREGGVVEIIAERRGHGVMLCTFCEKEITETELTYTEDTEPSHIKCLEDFNKHWEGRAEMMDLMGH